MTGKTVFLVVLVPLLALGVFGIWFERHISPEREACVERGGLYLDRQYVCVQPMPPKDKP